MAIDALEKNAEKLKPPAISHTIKLVSKKIYLGNRGHQLLYLHICKMNKL